MSRPGVMAAVRQALAEMVVSALDSGRGGAGAGSNPTVTAPSYATPPSGSGSEDSPAQNSLSVTLRGADTANCGPVRFYLYTNELNAVTDRHGRTCGGSFDVSRMPIRTPVRLLDRDGDRMQVVATRLVDGVHCQVDDGGPDGLPTIQPYR